MRISWGKGLAQQLVSMGMLVDYTGIQDPELEMQYIENQLNMFIAETPDQLLFKEPCHIL